MEGSGTQPPMAVCGGEGNRKPSYIDQGYGLLEDVETLLKILRSDRLDLPALEQLKARFDALAATFPDPETMANPPPVDPSEEQEKVRLRQEIEATNAEMKQIIDAYRRFQQDYGILFPTGEALPLVVPAPPPHPSAASASSARP